MFLRSLAAAASSKTSTSGTSTSTSITSRRTGLGYYLINSKNNNHLSRGNLLLQQQQQQQRHQQHHVIRSISSASSTRFMLDRNNNPTASSFSNHRRSLATEAKQEEEEEEEEEYEDEDEEHDDDDDNIDNEKFEKFEGDNKSEKSLDDLCRKHMDLPVQEFAMGCSFLHQIALGMNVTDLDVLLQNQPSLVHFRDYDRRTALHVAASEGHLEICQYLILTKNYAHINRSDRWGGSPLDDAHRHRHTDVYQFLQEHGATFGSPSQANNFITAASEGDLEEVQALLDFGNVNVNQGDYDRRTALHLAAGEGHFEMVQLLVGNRNKKSGNGGNGNTANGNGNGKGGEANVNVEDRWGNRPLDDAKSSGDEKIMKFLEQHGATHGSSAASAASASSSSIGQEALLDLMHQYGTIRDGVLSMDWQDVRNLLKGIGHQQQSDEKPITDEVVKKLFEVADINGTGVIDTQEFITHSDTFLGGRPARIILVVGGPGSGKGVLCERLAKECGVVHLSSGDMLRNEVAQGTVLGKQVKDIMESGGLVSSAIMVTLMRKRMQDHPGKRILLDGFPRSRENAQDLVTLCGKPELAIHLACDDDTVLLERIMKRGESGDRVDDNFHTAIQRVRGYNQYHNVTLDFLRAENVPIVFLDCTATPDGIWEQLRSIGRLMRSTVRLPFEINRQHQHQHHRESGYSSDFEIP